MSVDWTGNIADRSDIIAEMKCQIFFDPNVFSALRTLLVQALDKLCHILPGTFQYVLTADTQFDKNQSQPDGKLWTSMIACLPDEYAKYKPLLRQSSPPHIVSPLWILSSALCCRLQDMVSYSFDSI